MSRSTWYERERRKRVEGGATAPADPKPWEAAGVSRRTWQRRQAAERRRALALADPARAFVEWAAVRLVVPEGPLRGQPFTVADWQEDFIRRGLAPGIGIAVLSVARKNGKTALLAALLLAHLSESGPFHVPNWRAIALSLTGKLAGELRRAVALTAEASGLADVREVKAPAPGGIKGAAGAELEILAADKAGAHSVGADLVVIDELGLIPESKRDVVDSCYSCVSARGGRVFAISIRGRAPYMGELEDLAREDPSVVFVEYAPADPDPARDDEAAWRQANPGLGTIKDWDYMRRRSRQAAQPESLGGFRTHDLNLPGDPDAEPICTPDQWAACETAELPARGGPCALGWDLGGAVSMTAAAAYWPQTRRLEVWCAFPAEPDLRRRGETDGVGSFYDTLHREGELVTYPGRVTPADEFLAQVAGDLAGERIAHIAADRYRKAEVEDALRKRGLAWAPRWRGQGWRDGAEDVRAFQRALLAERVRCAPSRAVRAAIAESRLVRDEAGNPKLDKSRRRGRIDALQAVLLAVSGASTAPAGVAFWNEAAAGAGAE